MKLLFVGSHFFANVHGILWFVDGVMPFLENVTLYIVGKDLEMERERLEKNNVQVVGTVDCLETCAEMQVCRGQEKDALRMYEKILQLDADNLAANIFLGNYYYLMAEQEKKKLETDYKKLPSPTKMQYARYRDGLSKLFTTRYEKARNSLQKVVLRFPSTEAQKTLDKILRIEKEVNR